MCKWLERRENREKGKGDENLSEENHYERTRGKGNERSGTRVGGDEGKLERRSGP